MANGLNDSNGQGASRAEIAEANFVKRLGAAPATPPRKRYSKEMMLEAGITSGTATATGDSPTASDNSPASVLDKMATPPEASQGSSLATSATSAASLAPASAPTTGLLSRAASSVSSIFEEFSVLRPSARAEAVKLPEDAQEPGWLTRAYSSVVEHHVHDQPPINDVGDDDTPSSRAGRDDALGAAVAADADDDEEEPSWLQDAGSVLKAAGRRARRSIVVTFNLALNSSIAAPAPAEAATPAEASAPAAEAAPALRSRATKAALAAPRTPSIVSPAAGGRWRPHLAGALIACIVVGLAISMSTATAAAESVHPPPVKHRGVGQLWPRLHAPVAEVRDCRARRGKVVLTGLLGCSVINSLGAPPLVVHRCQGAVLGSALSVPMCGAGV